jgi:hypothetical protein
MNYPWLTSFEPGVSTSPSVFIREMPKTLEDVADLGSYICALDKG